MPIDNNDLDQILARIFDPSHRDRHRAVGDFIGMLASDDHIISHDMIQDVAIVIDEEMDGYEILKWAPYKAYFIDTLAATARIDKPRHLTDDRIAWMRLTKNESSESRYANSLIDIIADPHTPPGIALAAGVKLAKTIKANCTRNVDGDRFSIISEAVVDRAYEVAQIAFCPKISQDSETKDRAEVLASITTSYDYPSMTPPSPSDRMEILAAAIASSKNSDALVHAQSAFDLLKQHNGIAGQPQFVISYDALTAAHDAMIQRPFVSEPLAHLAETFWARATVSSYLQTATM